MPHFYPPIDNFTLNLTFLSFSTVKQPTKWCYWCLSNKAQDFIQVVHR